MRKFFEKLKLNKRIRYTSYAGVMMIGLVLVLLFVNYFITTLDSNYDLSMDMSAHRIYSLTSVTKDVVEKLGEEIYIYTTETAGIEDANVQELLKSYGAMSDKIHIENIDIVKNPAAVQYFNQFSGFEVVAGSVIVSNSIDTNNPEQRYRVLSYSELYTYNQESETYVEFSAEDAITSGIKYVVTPNNQKIWLLGNHSVDNASNQAIKEILLDENYQVKMLDILNGQNPLEKGDIVIAISLESDLTPTERDILKGFLDDGGRMIIGIGPTDAVVDLSNALSIIERYNIKVGQGLVFETDLNNVAVSGDREYVYSFIIPKIKEHEITNKFLVGDYKLLLGMSVGQLVLPEKINDPNITIEPLLTTADTSYIEPWGNDMDGEPNADAVYGEFVVMVAVTEKRINEDTKVIVLSSPQLFTYAQAFSQNVYKNKDFLLKSVSWLLDNESDFYISSKSLINSPLMIETMKQANFIIALVCVVIPMMIFGAGIFIYIRRNNL